jgi:hypothetical protein
MDFILTAAAIALAVATGVGAIVAIVEGWRVLLYRLLIIGSVLPSVWYCLYAIQAAAALPDPVEAWPDGTIVLGASLPALLGMCALIFLTVVAAERLRFLAPLLPLALGFLVWKALLPSLWTVTPHPFWYDNVPAVWYFLASVAAAAGLAAYTAVAMFRRSLHQTDPLGPSRPAA